MRTTLLRGMLCLLLAVGGLLAIAGCHSDQPVDGQNAAMTPQQKNLIQEHKKRGAPE